MKIEDELQSKFRNEHHKLMVNLLLTSARLSERFQFILKSYDMTPAQYNVLRILRGQDQEAVSIGLIKERMIERNSDVSRILDRMFQKKLVERTENANDRRQKDVRISKAGLHLLDKLEGCARQMDNELKHVSSAEAKRLNTMLDKLRNTPKQ